MIRLTDSQMRDVVGGKTHWKAQYQYYYDNNYNQIEHWLKVDPDFKELFHVSYTTHGHIYKFHPYNDDYEAAVLAIEARLDPK